MQDISSNRFGKDIGGKGYGKALESKISEENTGK